MDWFLYDNGIRHEWVNLPNFSKIPLMDSLDILSLGTP